MKATRIFDFLTRKKKDFHNFLFGFFVYPLGEIELRVKVSGPMAFRVVVAQFGLKGQGC
jgi:hypothetical protein